MTSDPPLRFLLDTNIVSVPMKTVKRPSEHQQDLLDLELEQSRVEENLTIYEGTLAIASITWHEIAYGIDRKPPSKRKQEMHDYLHTVVAAFSILPYDAQAAEWHARERVRLEKRGQSQSFVDGQIAAIAATRGLTLVTNNVRHFKNYAGLKVENWIRPT